MTHRPTDPSPRPWRVDVLQDRILDADGREIVQLIKDHVSWDGEEERHVSLPSLPFAINAELIVRAVNAYYGPIPDGKDRLDV